MFKKIVSVITFIGFNCTLFASNEIDQSQAGIPVISILSLLLAVVFFVVRDKFGTSFRVNKTAVLVALLTITLLAWPFKFSLGLKTKQLGESSSLKKE